MSTKLIYYSVSTDDDIVCKKFDTKFFSKFIFFVQSDNNVRAHVDFIAFPSSGYLGWWNDERACNKKGQKKTEEN